MSSKPNSSLTLQPPDQVFGLKTLGDKSVFEKTIQVPQVTISGVKLSTIIPCFKKYLLKIENFKPIVHQDKTQAVIYLNPEQIRNFQDLTEEDRTFLRENSITEECLQIVPLTLKYENYSSESVFKAVLPKDKEGVSSFTKVGHIVHVNLREHLLDYKDVIGEVLLDKVAGCESVVNKVDSIDNTFRNFQMEVLKGRPETITQVKENKCRFDLDFSKVYWNSRLSTEHERIVNMLKPGDTLFDVFAGIGPFSIPAAKKKCHVFSNDLNPESYKWLNHNAKLNKVESTYFKSFNKDGRDFISNEIKENLPNFLDKGQIYVVMNLPALAVQFLDAFVGLYAEKGSSIASLETPPIVVVYCFAKGEDYLQITKDLIHRSFGFDISNKVREIFRVRTVSSLKEMMRVTFQLDEDILCKTGDFLRKRKLDSGSENSGAKRHDNGEEAEKNQ